jgi:hypothetical protein
MMKTLRHRLLAVGAWLSGVRPRGLTEAEFLATFVEPMRNLSAIAVDHGDDIPSLEGGVVDIWPYVAAVPAADLCGEEVRPQAVDGVYRSGDGRWDHVLVATGTQNVHLVVVVDVAADRVHGHHLLDLNAKYGIARQPMQAEPGAAADGGA